MAEATLPPPPDAMALLSTLFANPGELCRTATTDFLDIARARARAEYQALEEAAAAVDPEEQVFYETVRGTYFLVTVAILFLLFGAAMLVIGMTGLSWAESRLVGGLTASFGLGFAVWSAVQLRRGKRPFLLLRPDGLTLPALDRPIAWLHTWPTWTWPSIAAGSAHGCCWCRKHRFQDRRRGGRRVKLNAKQRIVTFTGGPPRGMQVQGYADLLGRYRQADAAGRLLAVETRLDPSQE